MNNDQKKAQDQQATVPQPAPQEPARGFVSAPTLDQLKPTPRETELLATLWNWQEESAKSCIVLGQPHNFGALELVIAERKAQDRKWGEQNHEPLKWLAILAEELGEAAKAANDGSRGQYVSEMIQVSAVALAAVECELRTRIF